MSTEPALMTLAAVARAMFAAMDTNHDGYLSKAEVKNAR